MITLRKSQDRGHFDHGWLDTYHSFSFADYHDPAHERFGPLRVLNEDRVAPGQGFGMHPHRDMEIVTVILEGELRHQDNLGNGSVIRPGDVQYMSAGTGIVHSEFNPSDRAPVHLMQIWIFPDRRNYKPRYDQKTFPVESRLGRLVLVASPDGAADSIQIRQDARMYVGIAPPGQTLRQELASGRRAWVQIARGTAKVNCQAMEAGDGAAVTQETELKIEGIETADVIVFDLP